MRRTPIAAVALAATLGLTSAATGTAAVDTDGSNVPDGVNVTAWNSFWTKYRAADDWAPSGTTLADSGFRSFPDGFSFFNIGVPDVTNHRMFGTPKSGPPNLNPATMQDLMGRRVCLEQGGKQCTLTLTARRWMMAANQSMAGGHCFGFATTAQLLFQGQLTPQRFQPGAATTYDLALRPRISREIARQMAAQYMLNIGDYEVSPRELVSRLRASLSAGKTPYVLGMMFSAGGHAVTPYAVTDRGAGQFDVAIYDNNYPDAARAMRIDTVANTASYQVSTSPGMASDTTIGSVSLIPLSDITARQACPFCPGESELQVLLKPVRSDVPLRTRITTPSGSPIRGVQVNRPTTPWEPGKKWNFPTYQVPKGRSFVVTINAKRSRTPITTDLLAVTPGSGVTMGAVKARIPARGVGRLGVVPKDGVVVYRSGDPRLGRLQYLERLPDGAQTEIVTRTRNNRSGTVGGGVDEQQRLVVAFPVNRKPSTVIADATHQFLHDGMPMTLTATVKADLPAKSSLVVDYRRWSAQRPQALRATIVTDSGRRIPVPVTVE